MPLQPPNQPLINTADWDRWARSVAVSPDDGSVTTVKLANDAVTFGKMQDIATDTLIGRDTAGSGNPEAISVTDGIEFSGSASIRMADNGVTFAKLQDIATDSLIGRDTAGTGDPEAISVGGGLEFTGSGGIQRSALTGDVTAAAGSGSTTIANNAVTYAKMQDVSATDRILGRQTAGAGDVEEIPCTAAGRALLDDANASAQRTTLGLGTAATQNTGTSGTVVPLLDGNNAWDGVQIFMQPFILPTYTVATAPPALGFPRGLIYVSDETGGPVLAFSDGSDWRRVTDRAVIS